MVKILQAYNFAKQHTYALNGEILSATLIDGERIAISSAEQFIEIYDIGGKQRETLVDLNAILPQLETGSETNGGSNDERLPAKYSLATVGEVVHLIYCEAGKYLLTLEKENVGSPVHSNSNSMSCTSSSNTHTTYSEDDTKLFVRIYANFWKFPESKLIDMPITIRIASMTTPKSPLIESIDVIELPLRSPPDLIQCCQTSGNIIVGSKERIYLYEYTQCTHESTQPRFSYIDFLPFKFFVNLNFIPLKLKLAENVIACMNNRYCVAFKVVDMLSTTGANCGINQPHQHDGGTYYTTEEDILLVNGGAGSGGGGADLEVNDEFNSSAESSIMSKASAEVSSHNSFETDSLETTSSGARPLGVAGFPGRTPVDFNVARIVNSACGREFEVDIKSQWDQTDAINGSCGNGTGGNGSNVTTNSYDTQEIIITPTRASDIKIKLVNEAKAMNVQRLATNGNMYPCQDDSCVQYDIRKLLQICMKTSEPHSRVVDILRCIDLKAIYQRNPDATGNGDELDSEYDMGNQQVPSAVSSSKHIHRRTLKSRLHQSCLGYALLVASSVDGYLYQFCAQGKWYNENEKPVATYSFTAPVLQVHLNDYVIYAVTTESVETHTSRIGHKLFNNRFEYPTFGGLFPEESSPDVNAPIAVIGLCSFMHVQFVCVNRSNLVLISNSALAAASAAAASNNSDIASKRRSGEVKRNIAARLLAEAKAKHSLLRSNSNSAQQSNTNNEWTLYNLELPPVEHVVEDLEHIAETYRAASSCNFYDLMEEAHVMLRLSLALQLESVEGAREQQLRAKFKENCRKLANFSIRSTKKEVYLQATGFYKMCNMQLSEIYTNYINKFMTDMECKEQTKEQNAAQLVGLIYTVKNFLLALNADRQKAAFLNQMVKPCFTPSRVIEQGYAQVPLSLELLNMFVKYSQADIPLIMLNSPVVADAISSELINYLKYLDTLNPEENLLLAVTACRMSNYLLSQETVAHTSRYDLAVALIKHKNVLFDDGSKLFQRQQQQQNQQQQRHNQQKSNGAIRVVNNKQKRRQQIIQKQPLTQQQQIGIQQQSQNIVSFSDFTETILLATEQPELIEAISDVFIHALCVEHSVTLELILQLFLNYIATHIGHKGYQTSQKVFVNILQVYYYDYFDVSNSVGSSELRSNTPQSQLDDDYEEPSSKATSYNSERDNESIANSIEESHSAASSSIDERCASGASSAPGGLNRRNRIIYDQLQEQISPFKRHSNASSVHADDSQQQQHQQQQQQQDVEVNLKGLKILFRMYLGRLKALSDLITDLQSADIEQQPANEEFVYLRMDCIQFMLNHLQELRQQQLKQQQQQQQLTPTRINQRQATGAAIGTATATTTSLYYTSQPKETNDRKFVYVPYIPDYKLNADEFERQLKHYKRPIPCLQERPQYLNRLPPFKRSDFSVPNQDEGENEVHFLGWHNELLTLTLKIQSLLAFPRIEREIIEEFFAFIQKTPDLIGIDSFLVIVLPKHLAINFMLSFCPEYLWQYGKSNGFTPKHWESLLRKIICRTEVLPNWKSYVTEILNNLVAELSFEELLQCFPTEVIQSRNTTAFLKEFADNRIVYAHEQLLCAEEKLHGNGEKLTREHLPMDNIDEENVFELTLRKAVAKQRSIALRSMIESTGTQLFDAANNPMYNL